MSKLALHTFQQPTTNTAASQAQSIDTTETISNGKGMGLAGKSNTVVEKNPNPLWSGNIKYFWSKKIINEEKQESETSQKDDKELWEGGKNNLVREASD